MYAYLSSEVLGELSTREREFAYLTALLAPFTAPELAAYAAASVVLAVGGLFLGMAAVRQVVG